MTVSPPDFALRSLSVPAVLATQAARLADKVFIDDLIGGRKLTYGELHQRSQRAARLLRAAGVASGGHLGVLMENSLEHLLGFFGAAALGAVWVPVNTAARGDMLAYYFSHADCESVLVDAALLPRLLEVLDRLPAVRRVLVPGPAAQAAALAREAPPGVELVAFDPWQAGAAPGEALPQVRFNTLLMLAFTSGTTGPSKASMLSHAAALTYGTGATEAQGYRESDVFYVCLPLFHNNALLASLASALVCGGSVALAARFSVSRFWDDVRATGATITNLLGAMSGFLWSRPPQPDDADNRLRLVSMAPPTQYAREFEERFGLRVMSNYGLSDFGMGTSFTSEHPPHKLGSVGVPRRGMQMAIVDDDDLPVPAGEIGEIVMRSDEPWRAASGYYKMPEATLAAHRNQWFHTGDRGYRDEDGFFWFVDRKKDCIRRRGENISAFEVEQGIARHPAVAMAAVVPASVADGDEEVAAAVVLRPGARLTELELIEHCQRNMAYFMVPRYVRFVEALPATTNQKIEKYKVKQAFAEDASDWWDREAHGVVVRR